MGYKVVVFPVSTMRIAMKAIDGFLTYLKEKGTQKDHVENMQTRRDLYDLIDYAQFTKWEKLFLLNGGVDPLSGG